jgi:hypothetical protein
MSGGDCEKRLGCARNRSRDGGLGFDTRESIGRDVAEHPGCPPRSGARVEVRLASADSFLAIGYALGVWYTATHRQGARLAFLAAWAFIASFPA